jgi:hypothetical protein
MRSSTADRQLSARASRFVLQLADLNTGVLAHWQNTASGSNKEHIREKAAEIQGQLQTLMLYRERLLQRQRHTDAGDEQTPYSEV